MFWWLACTPAELVIDEIPLEDLVLAKQFLVHTAEEVPAALSCVQRDDPEEVFELTSPAGADHGFTLTGLLAETDYDCTFTAGNAVAARSFRTEALPSWLPQWSTAVTDRSEAGYTLLNHGLDTTEPDREAKLLIVDREGRLRWYLRCPENASDLDAQYLGDGRILYGGGYLMPPTVVGLLGAVVSQAGPSVTGAFRYNHHTERIATGEIATFSVVPNTDGTHEWDGFAIEVFDPTLSERTWVWNSQRGVDEGWLPYLPDNEDPYHANSMQFDGTDVYVNLRALGWVVKLDRRTGAREWTLGPYQDFDLIDAAGAPADPSEWFWRAHAPEKRGDEFLFHDNGVGRPAGRWSRAVAMTVDEDARTAQVTWEYTEPGWYEPIWGDVDRLPDGHVLITRGHCDHCYGADQRTELVEVDPTDNAVVWRLTFADPLDGGYRAERIDGCVFPNRKSCPP
ncbi:MAG: aryl-sulfate sulfotransferase [Myxococcota bacterium]